MARLPFALNVSDHAVLRWLERRYGVDVEAVRAEIRNISYQAAEAGAAFVKVDGVRICIVDGVVTTVLTKDMSHALGGGGR